ncbi:MAG: hypothetical protein ACU84Q_00980 [Gammaproteobacteria bacterium]
MNSSLFPHNARMTLTSAPQYSVIDKVGMPHVLAFIVKRLSIYNTCELDWLKLLPLTKKALLHGECMFPYTASNGEREHGFRIRASVNVNMSPPFQYEHWARVPSKTAARGWQSGEQVFHFADLEECAVHTLAHECFHFLSETKQVGEKNTEANANWWADGWLAAFRLKQETSAAQDPARETAMESARQATLVQPTLPNSSHQPELLDR